MAKAIYREKPKVGGRVEMFDGSHQGTIKEVVNPQFMVVKWDDGEEGSVHPLDVRYISE